MSTINALNYGDGSNSVPASAVLEGTAKAWANLNGTGTIALRDSYNIGSVTDNGTGNYGYIFTSGFASTNRGLTAGAYSVGNVAVPVMVGHAGATSSINVTYNNSGSGDVDCIYAGITIHGDLA